MTSTSTTGKSFGLNVRTARRFNIGVVAGLGLVFAAACGTEEAPGPLSPSGPTGRVRFVNLITDPARNPVNAILEGVPFGVNLGYTGTTPSSLPAPATANYSAIYTGSRSIVLQRTAAPTVTVATLGFTIVEGQDRTVYAIGGTGGGPVTAFVTTDANPAPAAGQTAVRVVNLSPTAGAIDVFLTAPGADLAAATPTASNLAYQGASGYVNVAAGTYQFRAVPAGTLPASRSSSVIIDQGGIALATGTGRTIVTGDNTTGGAPLRAFVIADR
jgi:uncharacterized protein DUF4397